MPLLLHSAIICMDHEEELMGQHCQHMIVNMLYAMELNLRWAGLGSAAIRRGWVGIIQMNLSIKQPQKVYKWCLTVAITTCQRTIPCKLPQQPFALRRPNGTSLARSASSARNAALIRSLQVERASLWSFEDVTLTDQEIPSAAALAKVVRCLQDALPSEPLLREKWSQQVGFRVSGFGSLGYMNAGDAKKTNLSAGVSSSRFIYVSLAEFFTPQEKSVVPIFFGDLHIDGRFPGLLHSSNMEGALQPQPVSKPFLPAPPPLAGSDLGPRLLQPPPGVPLAAGVPCPEAAPQRRYLRPAPALSAAVLCAGHRNGVRHVHRGMSASQRLLFYFGNFFVL